AVNPHTNKAWFDLLKDVFEKYDINEDCIYAADEIGISPDSGEHECVIGGRWPGPQYQQCTGNRENITIIVTVCADIPSYSHAFQTYFQTPYLTHSWIPYPVHPMHFLSSKISRLYLLLDTGLHPPPHISQSFFIFLSSILPDILSYPAHITHVYQGLDVIVFAVLKQCWSEEQDKWEREKGEGITKANFITIYGCTHLRALTPDLVRMAFCKTGVWPFDRDVVPSNMLAPSKETSTKSYLPITPSMPMRVLTDAIQKMSTQLSNNGNEEEHSINSSSSTQEDLKTIIKQLAETSLSKLISPTPMNSQTDLQHTTAHTISPIKKSCTYTYDKYSEPLQ
ncbi:uncharacterized protein BJ212DRAFT_1269514, partial [Suillus subaureus]